MDGNTPQSSAILPFPDFEALKKEVEKLRTELSMLVLERDDLLHHECWNIEMAYMLAVGGLEYRAYETECAILRLKRKLELIRAKRNRQEKVVLSGVEEVLDAEFAEYRARLNEQIERMNAALMRSRLEFLTEAESRALKKLYRSVVKALHPDLHPGLSEAKLRLFHSAVETYERGDLDGLRVIAAMVGDSALPDDGPGGLAPLTKEKARLAKRIERVRRQIGEIKSAYPYTMKGFVQDPQAIEARRAELEERIGQLKEVLAAYEDGIENLLR